MKFEEVIEHFRCGGRIRRKCWTQGTPIGSYVTIDWEGEIFSAEDVLADDWEIIKCI